MDIVYTAEALQQFEGLPKGIKPRVLRLVERLRLWPNVSGAKALRGDLAGRFRLRTGDYRLQFFVETTNAAEQIVIENIGHRDGFYGE